MIFSSEKEWQNHVGSLKTGKLIQDKDEARSKLKAALINAVRKCIPKERFGVLFSGGLDSSIIALIAKSLTPDFVCYAVGIDVGKPPEDLVFSETIAEMCGLPLKVVHLSMNDAEPVFEEAVKILGPKLGSAVNVGIAASVIPAIKQAKTDNINFLFSGLGAEEILTGYQRHAKAEDVNAECWRGLMNVYRQDLERDYALAAHFGVHFLTPFLDDDVIRVSMQIPGNFKITPEQNKLILREVAEELGLGEYSWRKKKAAQYGSNADKALAKLAKKAGFKYKKDYIQDLKKNVKH